jgi:hypothetical protein
MYPNYLIDMSRASLQAALQASTLNMQLAQALLDMSMRLIRVAVENQLGLMHSAGERALTAAVAVTPGQPVLVESHPGKAA